MGLKLQLWKSQRILFIPLLDYLAIKTGIRLFLNITHQFGIKWPTAFFNVQPPHRPVSEHWNLFVTSWRHSNPFLSVWVWMCVCVFARVWTGDKALDGYSKKKYVCKLLFIFLLGHDIDFGHMEAVNLLSSNKYTEKQIVSLSSCSCSLDVVVHLSLRYVCVEGRGAKSCTNNFFYIMLFPLRATCSSLCWWTPTATWSV